MDLGVEFLGQCHEDVLIAKHATLEVDNIARILPQPAIGGGKKHKIMQVNLILLVAEKCLATLSLYCVENVIVFFFTCQSDPQQGLWPHPTL